MTAVPTEKSVIVPAGSPRTARQQRRRQHPQLVPAADVTFAGLGVPAPLVAALAETGITVPFPIQAATLPDALAGHDILGRAQTGSTCTGPAVLPAVVPAAPWSPCRPRHSGTLATGRGAVAMSGAYRGRRGRRS